MNNNKFTKTGWIIFWFIFFWPVGVYFLYKRLKDGPYDETSKSEMPGKSYKSGRNWQIVGGAFLIFAAVTAMNDYADIFVILLLLAGGVAFLYKAFKRSANLKKYKQYISYFTGRGIVSTAVFAEDFNIDKVSARNIVTELINLKILKATLSGDNIVPFGTQANDTSYTRGNTGSYGSGYTKGSNNTAYRENPYSSNFRNNTANAKKVNVKCPHCGAIVTVIPGSDAKCDYCDMPVYIS